MTIVSFTEISTAGFEASPVASALAGLRANEARYFANKFKSEYATTVPPEQADIVAWIEEILRSERDITLSSPVLEVFTYEDDGCSGPRSISPTGWRSTCCGASLTAANVRSASNSAKG